MTTTAEFLHRYQAWRRGNTEDLPQPAPREVGEAIDAAIAAIEERDALPRTNTSPERTTSSGSGRRI